MTLVRCIDVSRTFGHGEQAVVAVHGCSCEIEPGARIAITGSSGSGKSTLLHLLAGLETPTGGEIGWPELAESPVERSRDISVVFQGQSLLPALTVAENVALAAVLTGTDEAAADVRAAAAMETVGITSLARQLADTLSGGQAQRTAIAQALAVRPRLLLADEPTGQLDTDNGSHVLDALLAAADETGAALIVTTHDPAVANRLTDRWQMKTGRLVVPAREGIS